MLTRLKWLLFGGAPTPEEGELRQRLKDLEDAARADKERIEALESQVRLRDLALKEFAAFHHLSVARIETWNALEVRRQVAAERPQ